MKQIDLPATQPQPPARAAGATSTNQPVSCASLKGAQTVVAVVAKKTPARADHPESGAAAGPGTPEQLGSHSAADDPVIAVSNTGNADADAVISSHADLIHAVSKRLRARPGPGTAPGTVGEGGTRMQGAVAFEAPGKGMEAAPPKRRRPAQEEDEIAGSAAPEQQLQSESLAIPGVDDRIPWMALTVGAATPALRPLQPAAQKAISVLKPKSRAECQRRCGSDGFCDPSSELGCGGVYCGWK